MTLDELKKRESNGPGDDGDGDDQAFYAGGERS